jgi:hypothetical protein
MSNPQFLNLNAAADYMGNGAIEVPEFQKEILDLVRRNGALAQRISYVPATGSISRFFEQTAIADGNYTDPRNINPTSTSPTRVEKSLLVKAVTNRIDYSLFDLETVGQQGVFAQLKAKDMGDMVNGILRLRDKGLWLGTDTVSGSQVGAGATTQYVGLLNQVSTTKVTIASGSSIVDGLRSEVAKLVANSDFAIRPTAIYMNPLAIDALEKEVKNANGSISFIVNGVQDGVAGLSVTGIVTAAGVLPIIPEPFLATDAPQFSAAPAGQHNYPFAIVCEDLIEYHYIGSKNPRVFQLGTAANLNESYVGVLFGAPVVKAADKAHVIGAVQF